MGTFSKAQQAAVGAVAAVVLVFIGFVLPGSPPKFAATAPKLIAYFHDHHSRVLIGTVLIEIGVLLLVLVLPHVVAHIRAAGELELAPVAAVAVAATLAILGIGAALFGAIAQLAVKDDTQGAVRPAYELIAFIQIPWYWTSLALVVAVALAASRGVFARWVVPVNAVIAVLLVLGGISVKASGVFAAGSGVFCVIASFAWLVFLLELGLLLWRSEPRTVPAAQPAAM
jgi:hypothetical protein